MKRGKWTRITAVLFAAAMLLSLSACGDTLPEVSSPTTTIPSTPTEQTAYWITFSHPLDYTEAVTITGRSTLHENHVQELQDMVGRLAWYGADIMADTSFGGEACFSLDGQKRYYINLISGEMFDGVQIADLSQEDINLLDYLVRADNPTHHATHTLTGTMQEWNKAEQYLVLAVTKADQTDLIGKNVKVSTRYDVGGVPVVGTSVDVGYDGTVIDGMVYGLTIDGLDSDQLGGPDTETTATTTAATTTTTKKPTTTTTTKKITTTTAYSVKPKTPGQLSAQQEAEIKNTWVSRYTDPEPQHTADAVKITYYGTYNGYIALTIKDNYWSYPDLVWDDNVGGSLFKDLTGFGVKLWKNNETIDLQKAYNQELITRYDCQDIAYYYRYANLSIRSDRLAWYPIKAVNTTIVGNAISFNKGVELNFYVPGKSFEIMIIQSREQLELLCENPVILPAGALPSKYNDAFFKDNALVVILLSRDGYTPKVQVADLCVKNQTLGITVLEKVPQFSDGVMLPAAIFSKRITLEVNKEDIKDVAAIEYFLTYTQ